MDKKFFKAHAYPVDYLQCDKCEIPICTCDECKNCLIDEQEIYCFKEKHYCLNCIENEIAQSKL